MLTNREKAILSAAPRGTSKTHARWRLVRIRMRQEEAAVLLRLAQHLDCTTYTGRTPGVPQISTLVRAIARGILGIYSPRDNQIAIGECPIANEVARNFSEVARDFPAGPKGVSGEVGKR